MDYISENVARRLAKWLLSMMSAGVGGPDVDIIAALAADPELNKCAKELDAIDACPEASSYKYVVVWLLNAARSTAFKKLSIIASASPQFQLVSHIIDLFDEMNPLSDANGLVSRPYLIRHLAALITNGNSDMFISIVEKFNVCYDDVCLNCSGSPDGSLLALAIESGKFGLAKMICTHFDGFLRNSDSQKMMLNHAKNIRGRSPWADELADWIVQTIRTHLEKHLCPFKKFACRYVGMLEGGAINFYDATIVEPVRGLSLWQSIPVVQLKSDKLAFCDADGNVIAEETVVSS